MGALAHVGTRTTSAARTPATALVRVTRSVRLGVTLGWRLPGRSTSRLSVSPARRQWAVAEMNCTREHEPRPMSSQSAIISSHQWPSVGTPWPSVAISGHQSPSVAISGHQWPSVAISRHQSPSVAISRHQSPSVAISRHHLQYKELG
jgi:hypothetical protein